MRLKQDLGMRIFVLCAISSLSRSHSPVNEKDAEARRQHQLMPHVFCDVVHPTDHYTQPKLFSEIYLDYMIATIIVDIRIIRALLLLILNKIYNTNFTNVMNSTKLNITEITGIVDRAIKTIFSQKIE